MPARWPRACCWCPTATISFRHGCCAAGSRSSPRAAATGRSTSARSRSGATRSSAATSSSPRAPAGSIRRWSRSPGWSSSTTTAQSRCRSPIGPMSASPWSSRPTSRTRPPATRRLRRRGRDGPRGTLDQAQDRPGPEALRDDRAGRIGRRRLVPGRLADRHLERLVSRLRLPRADQLAPASLRPVAGLVGSADGARQRPHHRRTDRLVGGLVECDHARARPDRSPHDVARLLDRMGACRGADRDRRRTAMAGGRGSRRARPDRRGRAADHHLDLHLSVERLAGVPDRPVEAGAVNRPTRLTTAHQSITFSRRMLLLGGAQGAVGALLIGRLGWLSIAQNQKYQLLSESNRVQLIPVPPRRGWIIDRNGKPIAINKASFRVDIIPQQLTDGPRVVGQLAQLLTLPPDEIDRINRELEHSRGFQPVSVADNIAYEQYAAITVRLPELAGVAASRGFTRFYPGGTSVGQLVGYVGAANEKEYEAEDKNPLLLVPGVKIGKEGLEKTLEQTLRGQPGGQRVEVTARGKLVKELDPKPDRSGGTVQLTIDSDLHEFAARRIGDQSCSVVVLDVTNGDI